MQQALAVYGSLAPGESNHWVVSRLPGEWEAGEARGYRFEITWGPAQGYDGFLPDPDGHVVPVWILRSERLATTWREIDDFEGPGYDRRTVPVVTADGEELYAQMYVTLTDLE